MQYKSIQQDVGNLRPHQKEAKGKIFAAWDEVDAVMLQMPTGTGKTFLFTSIIKDLINHYKATHTTLNILVVAHRTELLDQISTSLRKYDIPHGFIQGSREQHLWQRVQVASIFSILTSRNEINVRRKNFDYIIIDEAHHSLADTYKRLFETFPEAKKLGVTATPWRLNHEPFTSLYQTLITTPQVSWFIKEGLLADFDYVSIKPDSSIQQLVNSTEVSTTGDFVGSELDIAFNNQRIRSKVYDSYKKYAYGRKGIIFAINKEHAANLAALYCSKGVNAVAIDCDTPKEERKMLIEEFKRGIIKVLVNVEIFTEGFDCPDVSFIQLARPTCSLALYLQQVGRGLRVVPGKERTIIIDNVGLYNYFGLPDANRKWRHHFEGKEDFEEIVKPKKSRDIETEIVERSYDEDDEAMMIVRGAGEAKAIVAEEKVELEASQPITEFSLCDYYLVIGNKNRFKLYPFVKKKGIATNQVGNCVYAYNKVDEELVLTNDHVVNLKFIDHHSKEKNLLLFLGTLVGKTYSQLLNINQMQDLTGETRTDSLWFYELLQLVERWYKLSQRDEKEVLEEDLGRIFTMKCSNRDGYKAPHKAIYLMSIIDSIELGYITNRRFQVTPFLLQQFEDNWRRYVYLKCFSPIIWNPIFYMEDDIIHKVWKTGQKGVQPSSLKRCEAVFECLEIASDLWRAVQDNTTARRIKERLICTYIVNNRTS